MKLINKGALSVTLAWTSTYPQDTIKTKIQCAKNKLRIMDCTKEIYQNTGIKGFFKGLSPCLLRALVTGSMRYLVFDKCQELTGARPKH